MTAFKVAWPQRGLRMLRERPGTSTPKILCQMPSFTFKQKTQWQWRQTLWRPFQTRKKRLSVLQEVFQSQTIQSFQRNSLWLEHLSKIGDFLKPWPKAWWKWREDGTVEFFLVVGEPTSRVQYRPRYPFRSSYIKSICKYLEKSCEDCANQPDQLPINKMRTGN